VTPEQVESRIREEMAEMFELDPEGIRLDSRVFEDLDLDSIDAIDLLARLQAVTGKRVDPEALRKVHRVSDIVHLIVALDDSIAQVNPIEG